MSDPRTVTENYPPKGTKVIAFVNGYPTVLVRTTACFGHGEYRDQWVSPTNPTHWLPLDDKPIEIPEPPKRSELEQVLSRVCGEYMRKGYGVET